MDIRDRKKLDQATEAVRGARRRAQTAQGVLTLRRVELDRSILTFRQAGGSLAELADLLGVSKSRAQAMVRKAEAIAGE